MPPSRRRGQPLAFRWWRGQPAIKTHSAFCDHERKPGLDTFVVAFIQLSAFFRQDHDTHVDAGFFELFDSSPGMLRIWIERVIDHIFDSELDRGLPVPPLK